MPTAPVVRVYLITFRRPQLLPRALKSLIAQTFTDWICELQNGDPADPEPARLVAELHDPRIVISPIKARIGPVEAFNLAHTPAPETYQSILEDDNWWEPDFLKEMVALMEARPEVDLAWCNMQFWQEEPGNHWRATGKHVWNLPPESPPRTFRWPHVVQFNDFIYSNGAMLLRSRAAAKLKMPDWSLRDMIEHVRERMMDFPIVLNPKPLVNFAMTLTTFRTKDYTGWGVSQALLGASYLVSVPLSQEAAREIWAYQRALRPRSTSKLFFAAIVAGRWGFLRYASAGDWIAFLKGLLRHPGTGWATLGARRRQAQTWSMLCQLTAARTEEARQRGFTELKSGTLVDKLQPGSVGL